MIRKFSLHGAALLAALHLVGCGSSSEVQSSQDELSFKQKPQITIESPALGAFVPTSADGTVEVRGTTRGTSLSLNGKAVTVDSKGAFRTTLKATPGINVIDARLGSLWGGEAQRAFLYGDFAKAKALLPSGVMIRSTAKAFDDHAPDLDDFSSIAKAMLVQLDLAKVLAAIPPVTYDFVVGSVDVAVTGVDFAREKTALDLSPKAAGAHLEGAFSTLKLNLHLTIHFLGTHLSDAVVNVDTVGFKGDVNARYSDAAQVPDPKNPGKLVIGPGIVGSMARPEIALGKLTVDTDINFPGADAFVTWLSNRFRTLIANSVADQIQQNSANHFAEALNQLGLPTVFDLHPMGLPASLTAAEAFDARTAFDDEGATISASTAFSWTSLPAGAPGAAAPGSLLLGSAPAASFPPATFGVSVSFDALNQAAFAIWGQSGLDRTVLPAKSYLLFKLDAVVASPKLPPVLQPTADGRVQVTLGDLVITTGLHNFLFDGNVRVTANAVADVTIDVDPATNALRMTLASRPVIKLDVNDLLGIIPDALLAPLSDLLQSLAPAIVEKIVKPIEVPLPALPLSSLIGGSKASVGLAAPITTVIDAGARRVYVGGDLAGY